MSPSAPESHASLHYIAPTASRPFSAEERRILDRVNRQVAGEASLDDLLAFLYDTLRELYPCDRIGLAFLEDDGRRLVARKHRADYLPVLLEPGYAEALAHSSLAAVVADGCARIIYDLPRYLEEHPRSRSSRILVREGVRSSLTCPLALNGTPFGVIFLSARQPRAYTPYHVQLWIALAERLAQAVEKVWRIEQLQALNQAYTEMLAFVSHELKNPVASMLTDARVLLDGYLGPLAPAQAHKLERLMGKGAYLLELVRNYLDLARMEGGELVLRARPADFLRDVLEPALELVQPQLQARAMRLQVPAPGTALPLTCDPELLRIVLVNLLGNAAKYGREGGGLRVAAEPGTELFTVRVWNEGPGFSAEERPRLFRKFSRLQAPELQRPKGSGVGLYTAWRIVHLHGGRLDARSEPGQWAEFSLELPQPAASG